MLNKKGLDVAFVPNQPFVGLVLHARLIYAQHHRCLLIVPHDYSGLTETVTLVILPHRIAACRAHVHAHDPAYAGT